MDLPPELIEQILKYLHIIEVEQCYQAHLLFHVLTTDYILPQIRFETWVDDWTLDTLITTCSKDNLRRTIKYLMNTGYECSRLVDEDICVLFEFPKYHEMSRDEWFWYLYQHVEKEDLAKGMWVPNQSFIDLKERLFFLQTGYTVYLDDKLRRLVELIIETGEWQSEYFPINISTGKIGWALLLYNSWDFLFYN